MRRVLACGSRGWRHTEIIEHELERLYVPGATLITGGADGADSLAHEIGIKIGYSTRVFAADWKVFGKGAGVMRNLQMLREGKPHVVIAFYDGKSPGTRHMITEAIKRPIRTIVVHQEVPYDGD